MTICGPPCLTSPQKKPAEGGGNVSAAQLSRRYEHRGVSTARERKQSRAFFQRFKKVANSDVSLGSASCSPVSSSNLPHLEVMSFTSFGWRADWTSVTRCSAGDRTERSLSPSVFDPKQPFTASRKGRSMRVNRVGPLRSQRCRSFPSASSPRKRAWPPPDQDRRSLQ
jgi:hypothetical protein